MQLLLVRCGLLAPQGHRRCRLSSGATPGGAARAGTEIDCSALAAQSSTHGLLCRWGAPIRIVVECTAPSACTSPPARLATGCGLASTCSRASSGCGDGSSEQSSEHLPLLLLLSLLPGPTARPRALWPPPQRLLIIISGAVTNRPRGGACTRQGWLRGRQVR